MSHGPHSQNKTFNNSVVNKKSSREIEVEQRILNINDQMAAKNREIFKKHNTFVINIMSSPGSGKTTLLVSTLSRLMPSVKCAVIVGDICTTNDADRLAVSGAPAVQINTDEFGGDCHLAAHLIEKAASNIDLNKTDLLIVENIGNLVCPAEFDIGENIRVVILSVTEGEDKPLKYPLMFRECQAAIINKIDLLPYLDYNIEETVKNILTINPNIRLMQVSGKTQEGFDPWIEWIKEVVNSAD